MARLRNKLTGVVVNVPESARAGYEPVDEKPAPKRTTAKSSEK